MPAGRRAGGHDVAGGIHDEAGTDGALPSDDYASVAMLGGFRGSVTGDQDLHHTGRNLLDQRVTDSLNLCSSSAE
jgi:hypothetical protein